MSLPTNISLISTTKIVAKTPKGEATLTLSPGPANTVCSVKILVGGQELRKSKTFETGASGMEKVRVVGPLLQSAMRKIDATKKTCADGMPVEISVFHDGQWVTLKRKLNLDQNSISQLADLLKYIKRVNTRAQTEA